MRTNFRSEQLADPHMRDAEKALRTCVHCGFCTATCPTYLLLGDERDGPRGRIMLMQEMLESGASPNAETVLHLDRCLSCLGCRTACPSGVDYAALIDQSRVHIEQHYTRPLSERLFRNFILFVLTRPALFAALTRTARLFAPVVARLPGKLGAMTRKSLRRHEGGWQKTLFRAADAARDGSPPLALQMQGSPGMTRGTRANAARDGSPRFARPGMTKGARSLLLPGCVQRAMAPEIDSSINRVLGHENRRVDRLDKTGCCGALAFHLGKANRAKKHARAIIRACEAAEQDGAADAVLIGASGCAAFLKDYGKLFADDTEWKPRGERLAAKARDFVELATPATQAAAPADAPVVAFHPPCSLQHGQRIQGRGEALLRAAGFKLAAIPDAHLCCGSAGSYSLLQPEIAERLREKKLADIGSTGAQVIVSDNIGCLAHLAGEIPALHIAELLDWAYGGLSPSDPAASAT